MIERGDSYDRVAIGFHWLIAALVLVNLFLGLFHESLLEGLKVMPLHESIGITILVLSVARLAWRLGHKPPHFPDHMAGWEKAFAKVTHALFYVLMIALPLSGWLWAGDVTRARPFDWFGLFQVPLIPIGHDLAGTLHEAHETMGFVMAALVVLHVGGALRHHFLLRDRVLARMLPGARAGR